MTELLTVLTVVGLILYVWFRTLLDQAAYDAAAARPGRPEALIFGEASWGARVIVPEGSGEEEYLYGPFPSAEIAAECVLATWPDAILSYSTRDLGRGGRSFRPKGGYRREFVL